MSSVRVEQSSGGSVVVVSGDADLTMTDALSAALARAEESGPRVAVDVAAATLVDSRTIGVLLSCSERLRSRGGGLSIVGAKPDIRRLFTTIGLDREFAFFDSRKEATGEA